MNPEGEKRKNEKKSPTRRTFLAGAGALAIGALGGNVIDDVTRSRNPEEESDAFLNIEPRPKEYDTQMFAGNELPFPLNHYLGIEGAAHEKTLIDFKSLLASVWKRKLFPIREHRLASGLGGYPDGLLTAVRGIIGSYDGKATSTFETFRMRIENTVARVRRDLDQKSVERFFTLSRHQASLLKNVRSALDADFFLNYAMTALLPTDDGRLNAVALDFLLQNAGPGYVNALPSIDLTNQEIAIGPYALEARHLGYDANGEPQGAMVINKLLARSAIPPNIYSLRSDEHHAAACLLAEYNLALLVQNVGDALAQAIDDRLGFFQEHIEDYLVAAHQDPKSARDTFREYVGKLRVHLADVPPSYMQLCKGKMGTAVRNSHANAAALNSDTFKISKLASQ